VDAVDAEENITSRNVATLVRSPTRKDVGHPEASLRVSVKRESYTQRLAEVGDLRVAVDLRVAIDLRVAVEVRVALPHDTPETQDVEVLLTLSWG